MPLRSNIPNVRTRSDLSRLRLQLQQDSSLTPEERARILSAAQASLPEDVTPELEGLRAPTSTSPLPRPKPTATTVPEPEPPPMLRRPVDPLKKPTAGPGGPASLPTRGGQRKEDPEPGLVSRFVDFVKSGDIPPEAIAMLPGHAARAVALAIGAERTIPPLKEEIVSSLTPGGGPSPFSLPPGISQVFDKDTKRRISDAILNLPIFGPDPGGSVIGPSLRPLPKPKEAPPTVGSTLAAAANLTIHGGALDVFLDLSMGPGTYTALKAAGGAAIAKTIGTDIGQRVLAELPDAVRALPGGFAAVLPVPVKDLIARIGGRKAFNEAIESSVPKNLQEEARQYLQDEMVARRIQETTQGKGLLSGVTDDGLEIYTDPKPGDMANIPHGLIENPMEVSYKRAEAQGLEHPTTEMLEEDLEKWLGMHGSSLSVEGRKYLRSRSMSQLTDHIVEIASDPRKGADALKWYQDMTELIVDAVGEENLPEFAIVFSIMSPKNPVETNARDALEIMMSMRRLWNQMNAGPQQPIPIRNELFREVPIEIRPEGLQFPVSGKGPVGVLNLGHQVTVPEIVQPTPLPLILRNVNQKLVSARTPTPGAPFLRQLPPKKRLPRPKQEQPLRITKSRGIEFDPEGRTLIELSDEPLPKGRVALAGPASRIGALSKATGKRGKPPRVEEVRKLPASTIGPEETEDLIRRHLTAELGGTPGFVRKSSSTVWVGRGPDKEIERRFGERVAFDRRPGEHRGAWTPRYTYDKDGNIVDESRYKNIGIMGAGGPLDKLANFYYKGIFSGDPKTKTFMLTFFEQIKRGRRPVFPQATNDVQVAGYFGGGSDFKGESIRKSGKGKGTAIFGGAQGYRITQFMEAAAAKAASGRVGRVIGTTEVQAAIWDYEKRFGPKDTAQAMATATGAAWQDFTGEQWGSAKSVRKFIASQIEEFKSTYKDMPSPLVAVPDGFDPVKALEEIPGVFPISSRVVNRLMDRAEADPGNVLGSAILGENAPRALLSTKPGTLSSDAFTESGEVVDPQVLLDLDTEIMGKLADPDDPTQLRPMRLLARYIEDLTGERYGTHVVKTGGSFRGAPEPGFAMTIDAPEDIAGGFAAVAGKVLHQEAIVLERPSFIRPGDPIPAGGIMEPAGGVHIRKPDGAEFSEAEISSLAASLEDGYDYTVEPGGRGLRLYFLDFMFGDNFGPDDFLEGTKRIAANSGVPGLQLTQFEGRSLYVDESRAEAARRLLGSVARGGGAVGNTAGRGGSSSVSGQDFYNSIRPVAETLEAYVADGRLPSAVNDWPAMQEFLGNRDAVPQWIQDLFDTPQGGSTSGAIGLPQPGPGGSLPGPGGRKTLSQRDVINLAKELELGRRGIVALAEKKPAVTEMSQQAISQIYPGGTVPVYRAISPVGDMRPDIVASATLDPNVAFSIAHNFPAIFTSSVSEGMILPKPMVRRYDVPIDRIKAHVPTLIEEARRTQQSSLGKNITTRSGDKMTVDEVFRATYQEDEVVVDLTGIEPSEIKFDKGHGVVRQPNRAARIARGEFVSGADEVAQAKEMHTYFPEGDAQAAKNFEEYAAEIRRFIQPPNPLPQPGPGGPPLPKYPPVGGGSFVSEEALSPDAIRVWHGTPYKFDPEPGAPLGRFRDDKLLTGEGHMTFSAGHYLNDAGHAVAKKYKQNVARKRFGEDPVWHLDGKPVKPQEGQPVLGGEDRPYHLAEMERLLEMTGLEDMPVAGYRPIKETRLSKTDVGTRLVGKQRNAALAYAYEVLEDASRRADGAPVTMDDVDRTLKAHMEAQKALLDDFEYPIVGTQWSEAYVPLQTAAREVLETLLQTTKINKKPAEGYIVEAVIKAAEPDFILWDKPFSEQSKKIQDAAMRILPKPTGVGGTRARGDPSGIWKWDLQDPTVWKSEAAKNRYAASTRNAASRLISHGYPVQFGPWQGGEAITTKEALAMLRQQVEDVKLMGLDLRASGNRKRHLTETIKALESGDLIFDPTRTGEWVIKDDAIGRDIWFGVNELHKRDDLAARDQLLSEGVRGVKFLDADSRVPRWKSRWADDSKADEGVSIQFPQPDPEYIHPYHRDVSKMSDAEVRDEVKTAADTAIDNYEGDAESAIRLLRREQPAQLQKRDASDFEVIIEEQRALINNRAADLIESGDLVPEAPKITHNWVVYNPADLEILRILGLSAILLGGGAALSGEIGLPRGQDAVNPLPQ